MNNIIYDDEIITPENNIHDYYEKFTNRLNKRDCVKFSLFCAKLISSNSKGSNRCIELVEKWLLDEESVPTEDLLNAAYVAAITSASAAYAAYASASSYTVSNSAYTAYYAAGAATAICFYTAASVAYSTSNVFKSNKYLQILLRKTKQFQNNKILEQISKTDVDKLELVDWNMITDIIQEEYNIVHEFSYEDIFSRRCLIELLRREYL